MNIQSYNTIEKCYEALINLGCTISPMIEKSYKDKSLYIFEGNAILLDEYNLLN